MSTEVEMKKVPSGGRMYSILKRAFDVIVSACVLLVLSPFFLIVAIVIKLESKGPVFFMQERLGLHATPFFVYKFRSMHLGAEKLGVYEVKGDPRVTRVGRILRPSSINELPQFLNILKGEMSLIGPRPVLPFHPWPLDEYTEAQKKRFQVRPGLTGWAAVNGRKNVQWDRRLELDAEYVDRASIAFDIRILLKTVVVVLSASDGYNTTETARGPMTASADTSRHPGMTLLSITRDPIVAAMLERCGVDWVFVDLEIIGKQERQAGRNTVVSGHSLDDVRAVRQVLTHSKLLVRVNPWGEWSQDEIDGALEAGADILMLPFFKTSTEVRAFVDAVGGRAQTCLLLETAEAARDVEEILAVPSIDYVHIGLNDLHLAYGMKFMFEPLADGTVDRLCEAFARAGVTYGFGGMARIGSLRPPAEDIIAEHFRLRSSMVILSRSFCDFAAVENPLSLEEELRAAVEEVRGCEADLRTKDGNFFVCNRESVASDVASVAQSMGR